MVQSLQDAIVGDCFYFAISPDPANLVNYNYNLGSLKDTGGYKFPDDLISGPLIITTPGTYKAVVTADIQQLIVNIRGGGGGGGASGSTSTSPDDNFAYIGGGGGSSGSLFTYSETNTTLSLNAGDILEWTIGTGGKGAVHSVSQGQNGQVSSIKLNGVLIPSSPEHGINPAPGGSGGISGEDGTAMSSLKVEMEEYHQDFLVFQVEAEVLVQQFRYLHLVLECLELL